jgi:hypothetical protein
MAGDKHGKAKPNGQGEDLAPGWSMRRVNREILTGGVVLIVIRLDMSGSTMSSHESFRGLPAKIQGPVIEAVPKAADAALVAVVVMSGGNWYGEFRHLKDLTMPESQAGGGSPILASKGEEAEVLWADAVKTLDQWGVRALGVMDLEVSDFEADDVASDAGKLGAQKWQTWLGMCPQMEVTQFAPRGYDATVARMLQRPEQPQDVELIESLSLDKPGVVQKIVDAVKKVSQDSLKTVRPPRRGKPPTDLSIPAAPAAGVADRFAK